MPTPINPALIIAGPAIVQYKSKTFYSKGDIVADFQIGEFQIESSRHGNVESREATALMNLRFTPVGRLDALAVLWPYTNVIPGRLLHHKQLMGAINAGADTITITAHNFTDGVGVRAASRGTLPAGLAAGTKYYLGITDANTVSLHTSAADALADANKVNITDAGTGDHYLIEEPELVIHSFDGIKYTFHNAVVAAMPDINAKATETMIGEVTFNCYRRFATAPTDAAAFYTRTATAFADTSFDPADIKTEAFELAWGAAAPWSSMGTKNGAVCQFPVQTRESTDDAGGIISHFIDGVDARCVAQPLNIDEHTLWQKRVVQDAGAGRGRRIAAAADNLNLIATSLYVRLYGATIESAQAHFDGKTDRMGDITWRANRTFTAGAANPVFYVGAAAPA